MNYTKEQILEMSAVILDKLKIYRFIRIFICAATVGGFIGIVAIASRFFPAGSDTLHLIGNLAMAVNTVFAGLNVVAIFKAFIGKNIFEEQLKIYKNDAMSDGDFYYHFLVEAVKFMHTDVKRIEKETENRRKKEQGKI